MEDAVLKVKGWGERKHSIIHHSSEVYCLAIKG